MGKYPHPHEYSLYTSTFVKSVDGLRRGRVDGVWVEFLTSKFIFVKVVFSQDYAAAAALTGNVYKRSDHSHFLRLDGGGTGVVFTLHPSHSHTHTGDDHPHSLSLSLSV